MLNFPGIFIPEMSEKWKHVPWFGKFVFCIILRTQCPADSLVLVSGLWDFLSTSASALLTLPEAATPATVVTHMGQGFNVTQHQSG